MNYLIDPTKITNFECTDAELELQILFWICVAGKKASTICKCLNKMLNEYAEEGDSPFQVIRRIGKRKLPGALKRNGIGCYKNKAKGIWQLVSGDLNLRTSSIDELEEIYGIGMKTSRCFAMHTRRDVRVAGLDTHVLKFLRDSGFEAPKATPGSKKLYLKLQEIFVKLAFEAGYPVAIYDLMIWNKYSGSAA